MTGLDQTATTCQGAETPDPFAAPAPHDAHATPCMTNAPIEQRQEVKAGARTVAQERPSRKDDTRTEDAGIGSRRAAALSHSPAS
jgi:hypothetical protein